MKDIISTKSAWPLERDQEKAQSSRLVLAATFVIPAVLVVGLLFLLISFRGLGNVFLFGVAYAVGSLSCTLPIFLVVVGSSLGSEGWLFSLGQFLGYALGMGTIIFVVTIGAALFRRAMARWLRLVTPYIHRLSTMFLIGAGVYLIYYWVFQAGLVF
jgi:cytochrome c biogenesis protein CcdA